MKRVPLLLKILLTFILLLTGLYFSFAGVQGELKEQDVFPNRITMYSNSSSEEVHISNFRNKHKIIFYLNSSDGYCLKELYSVSNILHLYDSADITYILLWENDIPEEQLIEAGISADKSYSLKNKVSLSKYFPSAFILDENNRIVSIEKTEYISLVKKLHDLKGNMNLTAEANKMILDTAFNTVLKKASQFDPSKKTLVMFLNAGCKFCSDGEAAAKSQSAILSKKFNLITVRSASDEKQPYDVNLVPDYSLIYFNIYDKAYNAGKQPLFVILDNSGQVTDIFKETSDFLRYIGGL